MLQLNKKKTGEIVGLDIEAGSVAAAEVKANGTIQVAAAAIEPLAAGAFHEGEVVDADSLVEALKSCFSKNKLSKRVRLGIGNQRVVVRTLRLPAIEDREGDGGRRSLPGAGADPDAPRPGRARAPGRRRRAFRGGGGAAARRRRRRRAPGHGQLLPRADPASRARTGRHRPLGLRHDPGARRRRPG